MPDRGSMDWSRARQPSFFWQGLAILLPVAVLAVACWLALRQDEQTAETEARTHAAANLQALGRAVRASVGEELQRFLILQNVWMMGLCYAGQPDIQGVFPDAKLQSDLERWERDYPGLNVADMALPAGMVLMDGRQLLPPVDSVAPQPPSWYRDLTSAQKETWMALRGGGTARELERWRRAFLQDRPSSEAQQAVAALFESPEALIGRSNLLPSETGVSFQELACYRLLTAPDAKLTGRLLQSLWWATIDHPSLLSSKLLELAGRLAERADPRLMQKLLWTQSYHTQQSLANRALESLRQLPELQTGKHYVWSHWTADGACLGLFQPSTVRDADPGSGYQVWLVSRPVIEAMFRRAMAENRFLVPDYAAAVVSLEDQPLLGPAEDASQESNRWLGEVDLKAGINSMQDGCRFQIKLFLTSRERMLAAAQRRAHLFGALVLAAVLAALVGLLSARRAFRRQWQLNAQKSNFVASVSHELRAPIASVRLLAENLERGAIPEPARQVEYFRFIVQECRRLSALIENVLDFSRIEQGRKQYEWEPTDPAQLLQTTVALMAPYAAERGVRLDCQCAPGTEGLEWVLDGRAIQQALVNLIDNAVKHSPRGATVTMELALSRSVAERAWLRFSVADRGPGIPLAEQQKIFERFYRLGSELRRETQGVGIGLSVVKHIVEAHGGRVQVHSVVGQGSRFNLELPDRRAQATSDPPAGNA